MDNDDRPVGRVLTRREVLALLGAGGAAVLAACAPGQTATAQPTIAAAQPTTAAAATPAAGTVALPSCIVRPEQTEGPYFVDEELNRADVRSDPSDGSVQEGVPLQLAFQVSQVTADGCTPLAGAQVDIWHCNALGVYSDVSDPGFNTTGKKFLRGYQMTDANGLAQFTTIYPGWYRGRTVHIHFKIRAQSASGQNLEFTSQLYFDDSLSDQVFAQAPYSGKGTRSFKNEGDGIYRAGGDQLLLDVAEAGEGYATTFAIGLQMA